MDTKKMIRAMFFTPMRRRAQGGHIWGPPILFEGPPGGAKSSIVEQVSESVSLYCETVLTSIRLPEDFSGMPIPKEEYVDSMPMGWAHRLTQSQRGVVFFDEFNTATERVQHAMLRVVLDRVVGDYALPGTVRVLAAQNSTDEAHGTELTSPMANRFLHWPWEAPNVLDWTDYVLGGMDQDAAEEGFDPEKEEERVLKAFVVPFAKAKGLVTGFIKAKEDLLHKQPKEGDAQASKAWPSRRSWEMAMRVLAGGEVHQLSAEESEMLLAGSVGQAAASEFVSYLQNADLPDPEDLLDKKIKWKADNRLDRTLAVFNSCTALVTPPDSKKRKERAATLWGMLSDIGDDKLDIAVPAVRNLVKARLSAMDEARPALTKLGPMFVEAGLLPS